MKQASQSDKGDEHRFTGKLVARDVARYSAIRAAIVAGRGLREISRAFAASHHTVSVVSKREGLQTRKSKWRGKRKKTGWSKYNIKEHVALATDWYIKFLLTQGTWLKPEDIPPALVALKRAQLKLKRRLWQIKKGLV